MTALALLVFSLSLPAHAATPDLYPVVYSQTVTLDGVVVRVTVRTDSSGSPKKTHWISVGFHVDNGSSFVNKDCLTANRDFRYQLVNNDGREIPINQRVLDQTNVSPVSSVPGTGSCKTRPGWSSRLLPLGPLYPKLPFGAYTLHMTFAPRGFSEEAALAPLRLVVDRGHPL